MNKLGRALVIGLSRAYAATSGKPAASFTVPHDVSRFVAVSLSGLGDTLLSTPAFHAARSLFPGARIAALVHERYRSLLECNPDLDQIIGVRSGPAGWLTALRALRNFGPEVGLIFHGNEPESTTLCVLGGCRYLFKLSKTDYLCELRSNRVQWTYHESSRHVIEKRLELLERFAGLARPADTRMILETTDLSRIAADRWLREARLPDRHPLVAFQPFAAEQHREWPAECFAALAGLLQRAWPNMGLVLTGASHEAPRLRALRRSISMDAVATNTGNLDLPALAAVLQRCDALVTGDTGTMHLAVAAGCPTVSLFASADARVTGPYQDLARHRVIQKDRTCEPCLGSHCTFVPATCMEQISVEEVADAMRGLVAPAAASE